MHKLIMGSGLTLVALGGSVAAEQAAPTKAGQVVMTPSDCPALAAQDQKIKVTDADIKGSELGRADHKHSVQPAAQAGKIRGRVVVSGDKGMLTDAPDSTGPGGLRRAEIKGADIKMVAPPADRAAGGAAAGVACDPKSTIK